VAWGAVEGVLQSYCTTALASSAAQDASLSADGSKLGCADALANLKRNWYQHQLLAVVWLLFVLGLFLGLLAIHLLRHHLKYNFDRCVALQGIFRAGSCFGSVVKERAPSHHPNSLPHNQSKSGSCCTASLLLHIIRACCFVAEIVMDVWAFLLLVIVADRIGGVASANYQRVWWYIVVLSAPAGVTMLLAVPSVLSAYGVLDFARVRYSVGCCVLLFFSLAWVLLLLIVGVVGGWFIVMADMYMLVALCGVPHRKLLGNKLNMSAYTTLRFMCQGLLQALPSALICTAAIDTLLVTNRSRGGLITRHDNSVFWASLLLSMSRLAWEVFSLAALTYQLQAPCFVTAIVDVVHHLQPQQASSPSEVTGELHGTHRDQAGLESLVPGQPVGNMPQAPLGAQAALTESSKCAEHAGSSVSEEKPAAECAAGVQAGATPMQTAEQLHSSAAAAEGALCCSSWGGRACWPQQYPRFTVVYVWVVSLLAGAYMCVVCSHIVWPWLVFNIDWLNLKTSIEPLPAAALRSYSLLGLWGNWRLSGSARGSLQVLGSCDVQAITCNLTAPY
jgi:hypothetical protein